jgi:hypothetical protein
MLATFVLAMQLQATNVGSARKPAAAPLAPSSAVDAASATRTRATRATKAPVIDGRDDDDIWRIAQPITAFREFDPTEDGEPSMPTEAKIAFDDKYLYAFVRAFDPRPDSIRAFLSRRDVRTASDQIKLMIDSYNDKRSGYEFAVNPAGVKRDFSMSGDGNEDPTWDGVWDVATRIDDKGWTAEFRIPLSQMRFAKAESQTFGIGIWRDIARTNVRVSWPLYRRSKTGLVSQLGELSGIDGVQSPRRLEVTPYTVTKDLTSNHPDGTAGRSQQLTGGVDIKYGLTSNLTVDATVNPDFGQVEADPSVLNLTAFEQFYQERRPFFVEGAGIFNFNLNCNDGSCSGLFYSRRIGRSPQLGGLYGDAGTKQNTNIVGATKLTGRLANGLSVGFLDAATERVSGPGNETVEPRTNYLVARLQQDLNNGNSGIGVMATATNRNLDLWSRDYLRRAGYALGLDARHRMFNNQYELSGYVAGSDVEGSKEAIAATQTNSVHFYQRPDSHLALDSSRTSLNGYTTQLSFSKIGGERVRFNTNFRRTSAGFEVNDAGFLSRADQQNWGNWLQLSWTRPTTWYRSIRVNFNQSNNWSTSGLATERGGNVNAHAQFANQWFGHFGFNVNNVGRMYDDRASRGGPAIPRLFGYSGWGGFETDPRRWIAANLFVNGKFKNAAGTWNYELDPGITMRVSSRLQTNIGVSFFRQVDDEQWNGNFTDTKNVTHYTFARLDQKLTSITSRIDFTATPTLTLQLYAAPFITSGSFSNWRELSATPRADTYASRFKPYTAQGDPGGFNFKQFRSNAVVRWEYRPGSTLFLVWSQGREQDGVNPGTYALRRDAGDLFRVRPDNTFLIKTSYWFSL